jgi:hypothetical protein
MRFGLVEKKMDYCLSFFLWPREKERKRVSEVSSEKFSKSPS